MTPPPALPKMRRRLVLLGLAAWASVLSLESLLRPPGFAPAGALPQALRLGGVLQQRRSAPALKQARPQLELPPGVVELSAARYGPHEVRLLGNTRSGASGVIPVETINRLLADSPKGGLCLVVDRDGAVQGQLASNADWAAWRRAHPPSSAQTLAWLAGLQPRQANVCLWTSSEAVATPE